MNHQKLTFNDLAIFGSKQKIFTEIAFKSVGAPKSAIDIDIYLTEARKIITSGQWTNNGPNVQKLETEISKYLNVGHVILVCNATVGLQVALKALDIKGEVIIPSFTFVATAHAASWIGLTVRFCDVDPKTMMLDTNHLRKIITSKTSAIIPVHVYGRVADISAIKEVIGGRNIKIITDAAHAFGSVYPDETLVGTKGDCEVFSFHATKCFSTMEGGALTTNDIAIAKKIRCIINFGFSGYDKVDMVGTNGKMCEVAAAFGLQQLSLFPTVLAQNRHKLALYRRLFAEQSQRDHEWRKYVTFFDATALCNSHYVVMVWKFNGTCVDRDFIVTALNSENCQLRRYFFPGVHAFDPYREDQPQVDAVLPNTIQLAAQVICLPSGMQMSDEDIMVLFETIVFIWNQRAAIHHHLMAPHVDK